LPNGARPLIHALPIPTTDALERAAVFWFGQISSTSNSVDVRVGYTAEEITLYLAIFDRSLWYDDSPDAASLTDWDAVTLYLSTVGAADPERYRVIAQMNMAQDQSRARRIERWTGSTWAPAQLPVTTLSGWRGDRLNDESDTGDRGWAQSFTVPFAALGLRGNPVGAQLRVALVVHDRDGRNGPLPAPQSWPTAMQPDDPTTWATVAIGAPQWRPPAGAATGETVVRRNRQSDTAVADADVGGDSSNLCGGETSFWEQWPNANYGASPDFNIQNQSDIADWPCFARYYVTFELNGVPSGKRIQRATLTLHQWGNTGTVDLARPSFIQVARVAGAWSEGAITWNNSPQVLETLGGLQVDPLLTAPAWPGVARQWDVSKAAADAYAAGEPLRLALYSADADYHSGKLFVSSDTGDWNSSGRPTLRITWGEP
jgi:hypothetical protein